MSRVTIHIDPFTWELIPHQSWYLLSWRNGGVTFLCFTINWKFGRGY
jgi:hypothetical protein